MITIICNSEEQETLLGILNQSDICMWNFDEVQCKAHCMKCFEEHINWNITDRKENK